MNRSNRLIALLCGTSLGVTLLSAAIPCAFAFDRTPLVTHVVCLAEGAGCTPAKIADAFGAWQAQKVLYRPGSCFRVTAVTGDAVRSVFERCIPASWGQDVTSQKSAFLVSARTALAAALGGTTPSEPPPFAPRTEPTAYDVQVLGVDLDSEVIERLRVDALGGPMAPMQVASVCDSSDTGHESLACTDSSLTMAMDAWLKAGGGRPGSSFSVVAVRDAVTAPTTEFQVNTPTEIDPGLRVAHLLARRSVLGGVADRLRQGRTFSAIAEAMQSAIDLLKALPGRHAILVLSDFRQRTEQLNFERAVPTANEFRRTLSRKGLSLEATEMTVVGCGLHDQGGHDRGLDRRLGNAVESLWREILEPKAAKVVLSRHCTLATVALS